MEKGRWEGGRRSVFRCVWCRAFRWEERGKEGQGGWWVGRLREKEEAAPLQREKSRKRLEERFLRILVGCGRTLEDAMERT